MIWETERIPDHGIIPTGYERTLPPEAQLLVRARRRDLVGRAQGRVLDLGGAAMHRTLWDATPEVTDATVLDGAGDPRLAALAATGERFDTVVSVFQLASSAALEATLTAVRAVLAHDGRVLFIEPGALVGFSGRIQRLVATPLGGLTGWRADVDIPLALRTARLSVTDIERLRVPTVQPWLREVLVGVAHHALAPGGAVEPPPPAGPT